MADEDFPDALPARYRLHWYVLERVLGQGGFGITYLAHDTNLDRHVAIKEYLPTEVARRRSDASARPRTESHSERYAWGLERFLSEARTLARFDHPNIVRVLSVFEANNTAYMVMRFEEGEDLATLLDRRGTVPEDQLVACLLPVLDGLQLIHASGFIHRDIKPENIYVRHDGSPVLLDFGSARQSFGSAKTMTILVAPGYAPLEQYYGDAKSQGPWTDIYGLGATAYRAIAGRAPLDAIARAKGVLGSTRDILQSAAEAGAGRYDGHLLLAIDHALQLSERNRPQSIVEWRKEIVVPAVMPAAPAPATFARLSPEDVQPPTMAAPVSQTAPTAMAPTGPVEPGATTSAPPPSPRRVPARASLVTGAVLALCAVGVVVVSMIWDRQAAPSRQERLAVVPATPALQPATAAPAQAPASVPTTTAPPRNTPPAMTPTTAALSVTPAVGVPPVALKTAVAKVRESKPAALASTAPAPAPTAISASGLVATVPAVAVPITSPPVTLALASPAASTGSTLSAPVTALALPPKRLPDEQIDAAEAALRRGDAAAATTILTPLAATGNTRAQALLGRAHEARPAGQRSDFEAYVWYSIAARGGDAGAAAARDKLAGKLQPAEVRQADAIADRWRPRAAPASTTAERSSP